jgi:signal transduction histidine kinase
MPSIDSVPGAFLRSDRRGVVIAVNSALETLLERPREQLIGEPLTSLLSVGSRIFLETHVLPILQRLSVAEEIFMPIRSASGRDIPTLVNAVRRQASGAMVTDWLFVPMQRRAQFERALISARDAATAAVAAKDDILRSINEEKETLGLLSARASELAQRLAIEESVRSQAISSQLHEGIAQELAGLHFILSAARARPAANQEVATLLTTIAENTQRTLQQVRALAWDVFPPGLNAESFGSLLLTWLRDFEASSGISIRTHVAPIDIADFDCLVLAYRFVQDVVIEVSSRPQSAPVDVHLDYSHAALQIRVAATADDGIGYPFAAPDSRSVATKLRIEARGGSVTVAPLPGGRFAWIACLGSPVLDGQKPH